jgi:hypothetical protein
LFIGSKNILFELISMGKLFFSGFFQPAEKEGLVQKREIKGH